MIPAVTILQEFPLKAKSVLLFGKLENRASLEVKVKELGGFLTSKVTEHTIVVSAVASLTKPKPSAMVKKIMKSAVSFQYL